MSPHVGSNSRGPATPQTYPSFALESARTSSPILLDHQRGLFALVGHIDFSKVFGAIHPWSRLVT